MNITFWGVRGSYPVPGPSTVRYGGQTSCVEARLGNGQVVIVDAGTGLRSLGRKLSRDAAGVSKQYDVLLSHVHWDHIQGLPFFEPAYTPGNQIHIYALLTAADDLQQVIGGITRYEFFPVALDKVPANFVFHEVSPASEFCIGDFVIRPIALNHPFGAVGYRITGDGHSWAYISDTAPFTDVLHKQHFLSGVESLSEADRTVLAMMRADLVAALQGVDTVVYDTHFLPEEYARFPHYGHSTPDHALEICKEAQCRSLVLYHHAPSHNDDMMDEISKRYLEKGQELGIEVLTSFEGMQLPVGGVVSAVPEVTPRGGVPMPKIPAPSPSSKGNGS